MIYQNIILQKRRENFRGPNLAAGRADPDFVVIKSSAAEPLPISRHCRGTISFDSNTIDSYCAWLCRTVEQTIEKRSGIDGLFGHEGLQRLRQEHEPQSSHKLPMGAIPRFPCLKLGILRSSLFWLPAPIPLNTFGLGEQKQCLAHVGKPFAPKTTIQFTLPMAAVKVLFRVLVKIEDQHSFK